MDYANVKKDILVKVVIDWLNVLINAVVMDNVI
jgi:hypothetical protein